MVLFFLLILIFVPLGQIVSRELNLAPRTLSAYSWNLFGSLVGILAFILVSRLMLPPWIWLGIVVLGLACHQEGQRERTLVLVLLAPLALMLYEPHTPDHFNFWTPYHQIDYKRIYSARFSRATSWPDEGETGGQPIQLTLSFRESLARSPDCGLRDWK